MIRHLVVATSLLALMPLAVDAQVAHGGPVAASGAGTWSIHFSASCGAHAPRAICNPLVGGTGWQVTGRISITQSPATRTVHFSAVYTLHTPPLAPGAGLAPHGHFCAFGLGPDRRRFVDGLWEQQCVATVHGSMVIRPGAVATFGRRAHLPGLSRLSDFWLTAEQAVVPDATRSPIAQPLGRAHYPVDTRLPALNGSTRAFNANLYLGVLGIPDFPQQAVPFPQGVHLSVVVRSSVGRY